jgi:cytochrome P450
LPIPGAFDVTAQQPGANHSVAERDYDPYASTQRADPYSVYTRLRSECPVFYSTVMKAWVLTRFDDVVAVLSDTKRFSAVGSIGIDPFDSFPTEVQRIFDEGYERFPGLIELDPPTHSRYRSLVNLAFTPRRVADLEPRIRQLTDDLVDTFAEAGAADFIRAFAFPLPMTVICEILGVPSQDMRSVQTMADGFRALEAGNMWKLPVAEQARVAKSFVDFQHYAAALINDRRQHPREEDLLTTLLSAELGGERPLTTEELVSSVIHLLFAGTETTARMLGSALWHLLDPRDTWEALRQDPALAANAVEEALRMEPPVIYHLRRTREAVRFDDVEIPADQPVHLLFASANRDGDAFHHPGEFDVHREGITRHLGFGRGPHFCVGAPVGRLEGRVALEVLIRRLPSIRLQAGYRAEPEEHLMLRGLKRLPIEWDPATNISRSTPG